MQIPSDYLVAPIRYALVAGEPSGDQLGASLIKALKLKEPHAVFIGIGGPLMIEEGLQSLYPMDRLSVMGFIDPLKRSIELLWMRSRLKKLFKANPPNAFIGIDAPDFNLSLEYALKQSQIPTVHYVSPTVWAWRPGRIHTVKKAVDHMLLLFPFEEAIYKKHQIPATFIGHTLAQQFPMVPEKVQARKALGFNEADQVVALLPGSRLSEIQRLSSDFFKIAENLLSHNPKIQIVAAMLNEDLLKAFRKKVPHLMPIRWVLNQTREVLEAADVAIVTSGTATLETTLAKTPHVVLYKTSSFTYQLAKRLVQTPWISMTNIVAQKNLVREFVQHLDAGSIANEVIALLNPDYSKPMIESFHAIHQSFQVDSSLLASEVIVNIRK